MEKKILTNREILSMKEHAWNDVIFVVETIEFTEKYNRDIANAIHLLRSQFDLRKHKSIEFVEHISFKDRNQLQELLSTADDDIESILATSKESTIKFSKTRSHLQWGTIVNLVPLLCQR
jgi:hypothetical protein